MVITKYKCDLCGDEMPDVLPSGKRPWQRIKFTPMDKMEFRHIADNEASPKCLCGNCLNNLKEQLNRNQ